MHLVIEKIINQAYGLSHLSDGKAVFVPYAITGDEIEASVLEDKKNYALAKIDRIITPSKYRMESICPYYTVCGGCDMLTVSREHELKTKEAWVRDDFAWFSNLIKINTIINKNDISYRSRAKFSVSSTSKGFLKPFSKEVVNIDSCPLLTKGVNEILSKIKPRASLKNGEVVTTTVLENAPLIELGGIEFHVDSTAFFQANRPIALAIAEAVKANVVGKTVHDFYAGIGFFSAFLERAGFHVAAVESNSASSKFLKENLKASHYYSATTEEAQKFIRGKADTSVVDPPRVGMSKRAIKTVASLTKSRIIYVSCDYKTAIRDLREFEKFGFKAISATPFDMFPRTSHLECVIIIDKALT